MFVDMMALENARSPAVEAWPKGLAAARWLLGQRNGKKAVPGRFRCAIGGLHCAAPRSCGACPAGAATSAAQAGGRSPSRSGFRGNGRG